jgi:hypothetical protein
MLQLGPLRLAQHEQVSARPRHAECCSKSRRLSCTGDCARPTAGRPSRPWLGPVGCSPNALAIPKHLAAATAPAADTVANQAQAFQALARAHSLATLARSANGTAYISEARRSTTSRFPPPNPIAATDGSRAASPNRRPETPVFHWRQIWLCEPTCSLRRQRQTSGEMFGEGRTR